MPILPFIEDSEQNIISIVRTAHECGVRCIYPAFGMTLRNNQREYYLNKLDEIFPDKNLKAKYISVYGNNYKCICPDAKRLWNIFVSECQRFGILYKMPDIISAYQQGYGNLQLSFF